MGLRGPGPSPEPWSLRPVLLSLAPPVRLLQPGLLRAHLDRGEPPAAVGWGWEVEGGRAWEPVGGQLGSSLSPNQSLEAGQGTGPCPCQDFSF